MQHFHVAPPWGSWYVGDFYLKEDPVPFTGLARLPYYSADIAEAWEGVEMIGEWNWGRVDIVRTKLSYSCQMGFDRASVGAWADTAPLAICRAALKAVREKRAQMEMEV